MKPKIVKRISERDLQIQWEDGHVSTFTIETLRDSCPCAGCKGETVLLYSYEPLPVDRSTPGRYELRSVSLVGSYAMQCEWGDGHSMGIYTWDRLRGSCPCEECMRHRVQTSQQYKE
jgi:DUF971 family protein